VKLYVGNLSRSVDEGLLTRLAEPFGVLLAVGVAIDRMSGLSRGFGFVEFSTDDAARRAINGLDGREVNGQALTVRQARTGRFGFVR